MSLVYVCPVRRLVVYFFFLINNASLYTHDQYYLVLLVCEGDENQHCHYHMVSMATVHYKFIIRFSIIWNFNGNLGKILRSINMKKIAYTKRYELKRLYRSFFSSLSHHNITINISCISQNYEN